MDVLYFFIVNFIQEVQAILVIETSYCYEWQMAPLPVNASSR